MGDDTLFFICCPEFEKPDHPFFGNPRERSSEKTQAKGGKMFFLAMFEIVCQGFEACLKGLTGVSGLQVL